MIAFFDTTVHIAVLRGRLSADEVQRQIGNPPLGAPLTCDPHFASIRRHLPFAYKTLS
ncbi:MAG TPA: hypothetical protein VMW56_26190 [Candidatus Margulisiibacteriota bacterium]|nr:hypothetical protein [Candidatus Margulisiibacteriota bacterium]